MFGIGPTELVLIVLVVVLLFGAKKLPELARGLGKAIQEFKKAAREIEASTQQVDEPQSKGSDVKRQVDKDNPRKVVEDSSERKEEDERRTK